ncbi:MAG: hypothetical protein JO182_07445 [Acidobacteriaceae bacterium]|nr:hypothetical protein [Acidobacteriaceae bacterium]
MLKRLHLPIFSVVLLCAAITFAFDPGHMDADALEMLRLMRSGQYRDWYPLLLPLLLKISIALRIGPVAVLALQVFAIGLSTYAILAFFSTPLIASIGCYCVLLCPAVLGYLGAITSHAILTASLLCGFASLIYLTKPMPDKQRIGLFFVSFAALSISSVARVNALTFTVLGFCIWVLLLAKQFQRPSVARLFHSGKIVRLVLISIAGCTIALTATALGNNFLSFLLHPIRTGPVQGLVLYDVVTISLRANRLFVDRQHFPSQNLDDLRRIYVKNNPDPLLFRGDPKKRLQVILTGDQSEVWRAWRGCVAMYPGYYVTERWQLLRGLLGLDFRVPPAVPYHPGIDANSLGYYIVHPAADAFVVSYLKDFENTLVDRPFVYLILLLLAVTAIVKLPYQLGDVRLILFAFAAGNILFVAGHFVATPSTLLRYLWPSIVSSMVLCAATAAAYVSLALRRSVPAKAAIAPLPGRSTPVADAS